MLADWIGLDWMILQKQGIFRWQNWHLQSLVAGCRHSTDFNLDLSSSFWVGLGWVGYRSISIYRLDVMKPWRRTNERKEGRKHWTRRRGLRGYWDWEYGHVQRRLTYDTRLGIALLGFLFHQNLAHGYLLAIPYIRFWWCSSRTFGGRRWRRGVEINFAGIMCWCWCRTYE